MHSRYRYSLATLLLLTLVHFATSAEEDIAKHVTHLTQDSFDQSVKSGQWFIMFYAPWCPHCKRAAPTWDSLAEQTKNGVHIGMVNCVDQPQVCGSHDVRGYPTFIFFNQGKAENYNGARTVEAWTQFIEEKVKAASGGAPSDTKPSADAPAATEPAKNPSMEEDIAKRVTHLTQDNFDQTVNSEQWFIMFYAPWCPHCKQAAPTWASLAEQTKNGVHIGMVNCVDQPQLCGRHDVRGYPTFKFFNHGKAENYDGARTVEAWTQFIDEKVKAAPSDTVGGAATTEPAKNPPTEEDIAKRVTHLTQDSFDQSVNSGQWFIMFYAPWCPHCKQAAPTWATLAEQTKNGVHIGMVNCVDQPQVCGSHDVRGYPTFIFFNQGKAENYDGARTVEAWTQFIEEKVKVAPATPAPSDPSTPEPTPTPTPSDLPTPSAPPTPAPSDPSTPEPTPTPTPTPTPSDLPTPSAPPTPAPSDPSTPEPTPTPTPTPTASAPTLALEQQRVAPSDVKPSLDIAATETVKNAVERTSRGFYQEAWVMIILIMTFTAFTFSAFYCLKKLRVKYNPLSTVETDHEHADSITHHSTTPEKADNRIMRV